MSKKKKYIAFHCKDCELDFFLSYQGKRRFTAHCPACTDHIMVEKIREVWFDRPINYKRPWTEEEDQLIITGRQQGYKYKQIADALDGRSLKATTHRGYQLRKKGLL